LARANQQACLEQVEALGSPRLSSRDQGILSTAYRTGNWVRRQRLLQAPLVYLKSYDVLRSATEIVPTLMRAEKATPYRDQILELYPRCKGNLLVALLVAEPIARRWAHSSGTCPRGT
jgi:hypothetical protein